MDLGISTWDEYKSVCIDTKDLNSQYVDMGSSYRIIGPDANDINWILDLPRGTTSAADFENNYASTFNKKIENRVLPDNAFQLQSNAVNAEITAGTTCTIDFKIENYAGEDYTAKYLSGAEIITQGATFGDWAEAQIIDIDNVLGYGENFVLKTYVRKMFISPSGDQRIDASAPGAIPVGIYIRVMYHSVGTVNPKIYINYEIQLKDE
jgi:hypothetical protein